MPLILSPCLLLFIDKVLLCHTESNFIMLFDVFHPEVLYKYNSQLITQHFIYIQLSSMFCQGDMFKPYKVILRPSKKTDPRAVFLLLHCGIPNSYKFLLQNYKIHELVYIELV